MINPETNLYDNGHEQRVGDSFSLGAASFGQTQSPQFNGTAEQGSYGGLNDPLCGQV